MISLHIDFDPATGNLNVAGPLDNPPLAVFLLETVKHRLLSGQLRPAQPPGGILLAEPQLPPDLHGRNGPGGRP